MSECTHNCSTCGESCSERTAPQSLRKAPHPESHIGKVFGGKDHTTVMHACDRITNEMQQRQDIYNYVMELTVRLKQGSN